MKKLLSILIILSSLSVAAQQPNDDVDYKHDKAYLEQLIFNQINDYRVSQGIKPFVADDILALAAEDQTFYMLKTGKIAHEQVSAKKSSAFDRVMYYEGMHGVVAENVYKIAVGSYVKIKGTSKKIKLKSYQNVATAIVQGWVNSKYDVKVLANPKLANSGVSAVYDPKQKIKPLLDKDNLWKPHALLLLGDYFSSKGEKLKAGEFYVQILSIKNLQRDFYNQAQSKLSSIKND